MGIGEFLDGIFNEYVYNVKWTCQVCGKEIFDGKYFCDDCLKKLPYNDAAKCSHCGRKTVAPVEYCTTCSNTLVSFDKGRSAFCYEKPINALIKKLKYNGKKYLAEVFAHYLSLVYFKSYFSCDLVTFVPMTEKAEKKRGFNQSELLATKFAKSVSLPVERTLIKVKETERQAKLNRKDRLKNLSDVFRVSDRKTVKDKTVLVVDDVSTTGATAEAVASKLKKAGAKQVFILTVASVPPKINY